uniref:Uncharacterized protein n=1 Tax=Romanomermis culicivorax TaxID=13658 RepID=A0A915I2S6_ROMCU
AIAPTAIRGLDPEKIRVLVVLGTDSDRRVGICGIRGDPDLSRCKINFKKLTFLCLSGHVFKSLDPDPRSADVKSPTVTDCRRFLGFDRRQSVTNLHTYGQKIQRSAFTSWNNLFFTFLNSPPQPFLLNSSLKPEIPLILSPLS